MHVLVTFLGAMGILTKKSVFYSKEVWHELGEVYGLEVSIAFQSGLGLDS